VTVTTWEVRPIVFDVRFALADVEGIVDKRQSTVRRQVWYIVVPLLVNVLDAERSDPSRFEFPRCV